jgi:hypothetical protein
VKSAADILREHGLPPPPAGATRYYATCPKCSAQRKKCRDRCLGINVRAEGVNFGCSHCGWTGGGYYNGGGKIDPIVASYDYIDEGGAVLFQKVRTAAKRFWQRRPDGNGGWIKNTKGVRKVLYRLPQVVEAISNDEIVVVVEGEKDADNLIKLGVRATSSPDGAAKPGEKPKWRREYSDLLRDADVVVVPDNDPTGRAHAQATADSLQGIARASACSISPPTGRSARKAATSATGWTPATRSKRSETSSGSCRTGSRAPSSMAPPLMHRPMIIMRLSRRRWCS